MSQLISSNIDGSSVDGRQACLVAALEVRAAVGFDGAEVNLGCLNAIRNGRVIREEVERGREVLSRYPLRYTVHGPGSLSMARHPEHAARVLGACLEVSAELGAEVYVYHSGQIALHDAYAGLRPPPTDDELRDMWSRETEALLPFAERARELGLMLTIENRDPHLWELAALERWGRSGDGLLTYHQGMRLDLLAQQAAEINSPAVGVCLDVGHAFLAAPYWHGATFLDGVRTVAPWVRHVHLHDNFGRLDDLSDGLEDRLIFGEADNHLPPGWGDIPLREAAAILKGAGYEGWYLVEIRPRYDDYLAEALAAARAVLG